MGFVELVWKYLQTLSRLLVHTGSMKNSKSAQMLRQTDRTSPLPGTNIKDPVEFFLVDTFIGQLVHEMPLSVTVYC